MTRNVDRRILCDTHTHTLFSRHSYSTVEECVRAAAERGLELYGATDHYSAMLYPEHNGQHDVRDFQFFMNYEVWPREWHGVQVMHGCEADIVDLEGHLFGWDVPVTHTLGGDVRWNETTLKKTVFRDCDYVVASVHGQDFAKGASTAQVTEMYIRALDDPKVLMLGHIGRTGLPIDVDAVVTAARDRGKLIEINETSLGRPGNTGRCRNIAERCAELGCCVAVNTDAHIATDIGRFDLSIALFDEIDFPQELVANRNAAAFRQALERGLGSAV